MNEPHERLKHAREAARYPDAAAFAHAHESVNAVTYRAHEAGSRGIRSSVAKRYADIFRRHPTTRWVTAEWILYNSVTADMAVAQAKRSPAKAKVLAVIAAMSDEQAEQLLPVLEKLLPLLSGPSDVAKRAG